MIASEGASTAALDVPDDVANRMSLFYANNTLSGATEKLLQEVSLNGGRENVQIKTTI